MTRVRCVALAGLASLVGCGDTTTTPITQLNLDRPVDVAFACYGFMRVTGGNASDPNQPVIPTAMPRSACDALSPPLTPRMGMTSVEQPATPVKGQDTVAGVTPVPTWYAFLLQSSSGTVAVASWEAKPGEKMAGGFSDQGGDFNVLDADPLTPGKNAISIGEDPIAIITDKAGCFEVTANAGSCDLSELEINSALDNISGASKTATPVRVDRVAIKNRANKTVLARPAAMVAEPIRPYGDPNDPLHKDDVGDPVVGNACPASADGTTHASGKAFVAFPGCHLVAGIDTADGTIVSAISFDPATGNATVLTGAALDNAGSDCAAECSAADSTTGGAFTPGPRPVTLALTYDTRVDPTNAGSKPAPTMRLAIGAENLARITMVDLDPATFAPSTPFQIPLEDKTPDKTLGVTTVALSLQIGMGGNASSLNMADVQTGDNTPADHQAQFVYAVATDGTVRVADVLNKKHECDTQVDGRFLRTASFDVTESMCIDNTAGTLPRHIGARGPGIELPAHGIPTSVAIVKARDVPPPVFDAMTTNETGVVAPGPAVLLGHFAAITAASGTVYIVNIDDDYAPDAFSNANPLDTQPVLVMAHQLRDNFTDREAQPLSTDATKTPLCLAVDPPGGAHAGGPRVSAPPAQAPPTNTISTDFNPELPKFREYKCTSTVDAKDPGVAVSELEFGASRAVRDAVYPDLKSIASETWTLVYEGTLSLDNLNQVTAIDGPTIREGTIKVNEFGLHLFDQTRPFCDMGVERYDIADLRGCDPSRGDADCPAEYTCFVHPKSNVGIGACLLRSEAPRLADVCFDFLTTLRRYTVDQTKTGELVLLERKHELAMTPVDGCVSDDQCKNLAAVQSVINPNADAAGTTWSCQTDPLRKPVNADPAQNKRCVQTCSTDPAHPSPCSTGSLCRLNAGSQTEGVCMEGIEPPQACLNGPQRFDIRASEAFTMIGGQTGYIHPIIAQADGTCGPDPKAPVAQIGRIPLVAKPCTNAPGQPPSPNPCQTTVPQFEFEPVYTDDKCTRAPMDNPTTRQATAIQVSNPAMTLTLVDPTYPGDRCFLDRQGNLGNIPFVNTGYQLQFEQHAGYDPFQLQLFGMVTPVKIVTGPSESLWVIDDGDFVSTSITQSSTRGRVFRVESSTLVGNTLQ